MTKITSTDRKVFWKWVGVIGLGGLISGWGIVSAFANRWNAIPNLQESLKESQADRKALREQLAQHEGIQKVDMKEITMTLKAIQDTQRSQADLLRSLDRKLDRALPRSGPAAPNSPRYDDPDDYSGAQ